MKFIQTKVVFRAEWLAPVLLLWGAQALAASQHSASEKDPLTAGAGASASASGATSFSALVETCSASYDVSKEKTGLGEKVDAEKLKPNQVYMGFDSYFGGVFYRLTDDKGKLDPRPLGEDTKIPCAWLGDGNFKKDDTALTDAVRSGWCKLKAKEGWSEILPREIPPSAEIARLAPKTDAAGKLVGSALTRENVVAPATDTGGNIPGAVAVDAPILSRRPAPQTASVGPQAVGQTNRVPTSFTSVTSNFSSPSTATTSQFPGINPSEPPPAGTRVFSFGGRRWLVYPGHEPFIDANNVFRQRPIKGQSSATPVAVPVPVTPPAGSTTVESPTSAAVGSFQ